MVINMKKKNIAISMLIVFTLVFSGLNLSVAKDINCKNQISVSSNVNYRAVLVGIDDYPGTANDLDTPIFDLRSMYDALKRGNPVYRIHPLENDSATRSNVLDEIKWLENEAKKDNGETVSIFYFCGHGTTLDSKDTDREGDRFDECLCLYDEYLRDDELTDALALIPGTVIVFLDSCFCAGFIDDLDYIKNDWISDEIVMFTAHGEYQSLFENLDIERGLHTFFIVSALMTDTNRDGNIKLGELKTSLVKNYNELLERWGTSYEIDEENIYPFSNFPSRKIILEGFTNSAPVIDPSCDGPNKAGEIDYNIELTDSDGDKMRLLIYWRDGYVQGWGGCHSGDTLSRYHKYTSSGDYKILVLAKDANEAVTLDVSENIHVESKQKIFLNSYLSNFPLIQQILQKLNL